MSIAPPPVDRARPEPQPTNTATSYTDTTVTNGTTYYYVITAVNNSGQSGYSSQVSATPFWWGIIERHDRRPGQLRLRMAALCSQHRVQPRWPGYVGAAQNGSFSGESRAGLGTSIGEAFSLSNATNLTDFELNESGGAVTPNGGHVNFIVTFGTLSTSSGTFTATVTEDVVRGRVPDCQQRRDSQHLRGFSTGHADLRPGIGFRDRVRIRDRRK